MVYPLADYQACFFILLRNHVSAVYRECILMYPECIGNVFMTNPFSYIHSRSMGHHWPVYIPVRTLMHRLPRSWYSPGDT